MPKQALLNGTLEDANDFDSYSELELLKKSLVNNYWLITESGQLISKTSVEHVVRDDYLQEDTKRKISEFNEKIESRLDDANFMIEGDGNSTMMYLEDIDDDDEH